MSAPARIAFAALVSAVAFGPLAGCGYSTASLMPEGVSSIAVPMAENQTFYRGDEFLYTRYVQREIVRRTQVQVRECNCADAILHAKILRMRRVPLVEGRNDIVLEEGLIGAVEVTLTERRSGRILSTFVLERRSEAVFARGDDLVRNRDRLMAELAEDTVVRLQDASFLAWRGYSSGYTDTRPTRGDTQPSR